MSDDFFSDAVPSCSFAGDFPIKWKGKILELTKKQATTYNPDNPGTGEPRVWPDGNPMMHGWITLQVSEGPEGWHKGDDDDGRRVLVLDSKNKREAVQAAVKASGSKISIGGDVEIEYYGRDPNGKNKDNLPKLYRSAYTPGAPTPTEPPQSQVGTPAAAATATASGGGDPNVALLINKGCDPVKVAEMTPEARAVLAATF